MAAIKVITGSVDSDGVSVFPFQSEPRNATDMPLSISLYSWTSAYSVPRSEFVPTDRLQDLYTSRLLRNAPISVLGLTACLFVLKDAKQVSYRAFHN